jgi:hypothetical protein
VKRLPFVSLVLAAAVLGCPASAFAHDDLDAALRHYERAEFDRAVAAFDRAAASSHLTRDELEAVLRGRGLAHHAAGDVGAAEEDLASLLSIAPGVSLDDTTPPAVRRLYERLREEVVQLAVEGVVLPSSTGYAVSLRVTGDVGSLQRGVRIHYESASGVETVEAERAEVLSDASELRYWVEVIGPGGAVLASAGSAERPLTYGRATALAATSNESVGDVAPSDDTGIIVGVTVAIVVVVAAIAVVLALVLAPPPDTALSGPMRVEMP